MKNPKQTLLAGLICGAAASAGVQAEESASNLAQAITGGKATINFRLRSEDVSVANDAGDAEATANTLRTRLTLQSASLGGFGATFEYDYVKAFGDVDYNVYPGPPAFPGAGTIFDPDGGDINQGYLSYSSNGTTVKYGRQRILLDNQRFVGGVGWRQNEQTYDGLSIASTAVDNFSFYGAYIYNVNRIFGKDHGAGDHSNKTVLLNAKYKFEDIGSLSSYYYKVENENAASFSSDTIGFRFLGKTGDFSYTAELASQNEGRGSPLNYQAMYALLEGSYKIAPVTIKAGYELLGADGSDGMFITPLATLHAFQGWTDKFLNGGKGNINGGIQDFYVNVGGKFGPVNAAVVYHILTSDDSAAAPNGAEDLGTEAGIVVKGKVGPVGLLAKYATYSADDFGTDTDKLWLMATMKF